MTAKSKLIFALTFAGLFAASTQVRADDDNVTVNGLPCNSACRAWLGIKAAPADPKPAESKADAPTSEDAEDEKPAPPRKIHKTLAQRGNEIGAPPAHPKRHKEAAARRVKEAQPAVAAAPRPEAKGPHFWESQDFANEISSRISKAPATKVGSSPAARVAAPVAAKPSPLSEKEGTLAAAPAEPAEATKAQPPAPEQTVVVAPSPPASTPDEAASVQKLTEALKAAPPSPVPSVVATPQAPANNEAANAAPAAVIVEKPAEAARPEVPAPNPVVLATPAIRDASKETAPLQDGSGKPSAPPPEASPILANEGGPKPSPASAEAETQVAAASPSAEIKAPGQVLIVLAKPEIKEVADLKDRSIVVAGVYALSSDQLQASFAAKGANGLALKQGGAGDVEQLWNGQVAAAVVAVAEPKIAAAFREVPGYHLLLVQVAPAASP